MPSLALLVQAVSDMMNDGARETTMATVGRIEETTVAATAPFCTRLRVYGQRVDLSGAAGFMTSPGRYEISVAKSTGSRRTVKVWEVSWGVDRARGWSRRWEAWFASESEARAFAAAKLDALRAWAEKLERADVAGAA